MYDHTIKSLPYENPRFHWKQIGLCGIKTKNNKLKNLEQLILENGHLNEENMILKLDIEGWEWESIIDLKEDPQKINKVCEIMKGIQDEIKNISEGNITYKFGGYDSFDSFKNARVIYPAIIRLICRNKITIFKFIM